MTSPGRDRLPMHAASQVAMLSAGGAQRKGARPGMDSRHIATLGAFGVILGWVIFYTVFASYPLGAIREGLRLGLAPSASEGGLSVQPGDTLTSATTDALGPVLGESRFALFVRTPENAPFSSWIARYVEVLRSVYGPEELQVFLYLGTSADTEAAIGIDSVLGLNSASTFSVLLERNKYVRFAADQPLHEDELRQLVVQSLGPPSLKAVTDVATWRRRLDGAVLTGLDGTSATSLLGSSDSHSQVLVMLEAQCDACTLKEYLQDVVALRDSFSVAVPPQQVRVVAPAHYLHGPTASVLDTLGIPVVLTHTVIAPEIAFHTRASDVAAPVVLFVANGEITGIARLGRSGELSPGM